MLWLPLLTACLLTGRQLHAQSPEALAAPERRARAPVADKPLFRDPVYDGAADPSVIYNFAEQAWYMFYTNRRANLPDEQVDGVNWCHATKIGMARSADGAKWEYVGTANIDVGGDNVSYWAPDVVWGNGAYHMFLTVVPGVFSDWNHPRSIVHLVSQDLKNWTYQSTLELASDRVIDASVVRLAEGGWRLWYNNEPDGKSIYVADSDDLVAWRDRGKVALPDFRSGEGPKVFFWHDQYWMVVDTWGGLAVFRSQDALQWERQPETLLRTPGRGADDGVMGQHPDVVATGNRAYIFYFTHPGRVPQPGGGEAQGVDFRRTSIQTAELKLQDGWLTCDRDAPTRMDLRFRRPAQIHDPSTILRVGSRFWCFSTGVGVQRLYSDDLVNWRRSEPVFAAPPAWVGEVVPNFRGGFWAPDVIERDGRFLLYYSVSAFGKRTSAIALASSPSLEPAAAGGPWTDHGIVVQTSEADDFNAIDPAVIAAADGELWLVFGSFWSGIKLIQLDPQTGKRLGGADSPMYSLAWNEQIEAPFIAFHDGYYYLFVNWGHCCRGVRSTYNIRVGRSRDITGPYVDRDGVDLLRGGGTLVLDSEGPAIGPGHPALLEHQGQLMLTHHYYDGDHRGQPRLGINRLSWDEAGWPLVERRMTYAGAIVEGESDETPRS